MPKRGDGGEGSGRREGRKVSSRISELMGMFGEGGGRRKKEH